MWSPSWLTWSERSFPSDIFQNIVDRTGVVLTADQCETAPARALANLRSHLSTMRGALGDGYLRTEQDLVSLDGKRVWLDVAEFRTLASEPAGRGPDSLAATDALYTGPFMQGFTLNACPEFDAWQFFVREESHRLYAESLTRLVQIEIDRREFDRAVAYARDLLTREPLDEEMHRTLMRLYAWQRQWPAALRQFEVCEQVLATELGVSTGEETKALLMQITARRVDPPVDWDPLDAAPKDVKIRPRPGGNLPASASPIVGRQEELNSLNALPHLPFYLADHAEQRARSLTGHQPQQYGHEIRVLGLAEAVSKAR